METSENSNSSSSSISAGFLVGRRNRSISLLRSSERKSFRKPKKHYYRVKGLIPSMPWHAVFAFLNPLLIGVMQVKCQNASSSPFLTNPTDMWTFLLATLIYCFAFAANIKWRPGRSIYALFSGHIALISGSLSSVSLFSIFLPTLFGRLILFLWIFLPVLVLRQFLYWPFQWTLKAAASRLVSNIRKRFNIDGNNVDEHPQSVLVLV